MLPNGPSRLNISSPAFDSSPKWQRGIALDFDRQGLEAFIRGGEKSPPPVFVGRESIIRDIEEAAAAGWKGKIAVGCEIPGMTRIIQGAPGAGKSSILAELHSRSLASTGRPGAPRVMSAAGEDICEDLPSVIMAVAAAGGLSAEKWRGLLPGGLSVGASVSIASLSGALNWSRSEPPVRLAGLRRRFPPEKWKAPVIIAVDEAQRLPGDPAAPHARFFQRLHDGDTGLPLTLVLAGLGDTRDVARGCGLTRGLNTHEIGSLARSDVETLMTAFCQHFGLDPAGCEERLDNLAAPAEGWPRHLHFALRALAREALGTGGDLFRVGWPKIGREAAASRRRYYEDQRSPEMREADRLTGAVMLGLRPGMREGDVLRLIRSSVRDEPGFDLPEGMNARGFLTCLTHNGALQRTADDGMASPIPSFRRHLIAAAGLGPDPAPPGRLPDRAEFAGLLEEAAERLEFAESKLGYGLPDEAVWSALLDRGRGALGRLERAGELAERLLADALDGAAALTAADRHRARAEITLRSAKPTGDVDTDPGGRLREGIGEAEREVRSARLVPGVDPDPAPPAADGGAERERDDDAPSPM